MSTSVPSTEAIAPARVRYGSLIDEALSWCDEHGVAADADAFALICAGAGSRVHECRSAPWIWTRVGVTVLLSRGIATWCVVNGGTTCPVEVVPSVWRWLDFLHDTGRLDPRGDPLWELRKPLICYGGLDVEGRPRPVDAPSPIPCECHLPYRKAVGFLNDLMKDDVPAPDLLYRSRRGETPAPIPRRAKDPPRRALARGGARPGSGTNRGPKGRRR